MSKRTTQPIQTRFKKLAHFSLRRCVRVDHMRATGKRACGLHVGGVRVVPVVAAVTVAPARLTVAGTGGDGIAV